MFENKSFINKQSGTRQSVTNNLMMALVALIGAILVLVAPAHAVRADDGDQTYTQNFQNDTMTLSGKSVTTSLNFTKEDYWDIHKAQFNFSFQVSQLSNRQTSDITLSLNGVKFYSFRPDKTSGLQSKTVDLPLDLLQGSNVLTINGQIINQAGQTSDLVTTPANWLTLSSGANVNFTYHLNEASEDINSFYAHFIGMDTIVNRRSAIVMPHGANDAELTASAYAFAGVARVIATTDGKLNLTRWGSSIAQQADYRLVVAQYDRLPADLKRFVKADQVTAQRAVLQTATDGSTHYLIVTARTGGLLKKAAQFVANQELMKETTGPTESVTAQTSTSTSVLQYQGSRQLTTGTDRVSGTGQHTLTYVLSVPIDRTNSQGSVVHLHLRYADNLNFKNSLVTLKVGDQTVGSAHLDRARANGGTYNFRLPAKLALGNSFTVSVVFNLQLAGSGGTTDVTTPWAELDSQSTAAIKTTPQNSLLFTNYPSTFISNQTFDNVVVVRPRSMNDDDLAALTNIMNLLGNYAQQNTGSIRFTTQVPSTARMKQSSVIAFGTYHDNALVRKLNGQLYFRFARGGNRILSNEKLSIEHRYGATIGTAQLLRSPYNQQRALLVATAAHSSDVVNATTQLSTQADVSGYKGDALVIDRDNNHYSYRFKKNAAADVNAAKKQKLTRSRQVIIYLVVAAAVIVVVVAIMVLILRKNGMLRRKETGDEK